MSYTVKELRAFPPRGYLDALNSFTWGLEDFATDIAKQYNSTSNWFGPVERGLLLALLSCAEDHAATIAAFKEVGASLKFEPAQKVTLDALNKTVAGFEKKIAETVKELGKIKSTW